ncbi:MAG: DUF1573 domain-containing protein [Planctomycetales bacterium]|nr:DUF1573 domain-containing protein [Planctomycetales bacterium]
MSSHRTPKETDAKPSRMERENKEFPMRWTWILLGTMVLGVATGAGAAYLSYGDPGLVYRQMLDPDFVMAPTTPTTGTPIVSIPDGDEFSFGASGAGSTGVHAFRIENTGTADLALRIVATSCGCTVGKLKREIVPPGEFTHVEVAWTPGKAVERFYQVATIGTNDPLRRYIDFAVSGRVIPVLRAEPNDLAFTDMAYDEARHAEVALYSYTRDDLQVTEHQWEHERLREYFDVSFEPLDHERLQAEPDAKSGILCRIQVKAGIEHGPFFQTLQLAFNAEDVPDLQIPIHGSVVGELSVNGPTYNKEQRLINIGSVGQSKGSIHKLNVFVKGEGHENIELTTGQIEPESLLVHFDPVRSVGPVSIHPIRIEVPQGSPFVNRMGTDNAPAGRVELLTTHSPPKKLVIFVRYAVVNDDDSAN